MEHRCPLCVSVCLCYGLDAYLFIYIFIYHEYIEIVDLSLNYRKYYMKIYKPLLLFAFDRHIALRGEMVCFLSFANSIYQVF